MADPSSSTGTRLSSVRNAARLLNQFSRTDRELGVTQMARRLDLAVSTTHRLFSALMEEGLVERGQAPGTYRLGLRVYELGVTVFPNLDLHEASKPVLAALRQSTGETVHLAVLDRLDVVYLERLESPQIVRIFQGLDHRRPAHTSSTGKVLLAYLPAELLEDRLKDWEPVSPTPNTIVDKDRLLADLGKVRKRGWAQNIEEGLLGVASVAAPVRDEDGTVIAAVSVVSPISRARGALRQYRTAVIEAADVISRRIGYRTTASR